MIPHVTLGVNTARCRARIDTTEIVADFVGGALGIFDTLRTTAASVRVTFITGTALANSAEGTSQTLGIGATAETRARIAVAIIIERTERIEGVGTEVTTTTADHSLSVARESAERIAVAAAAKRG